MTETYSLSTDFGGVFGAGQFDAEIRADPNITTPLLYITVYGDVISIVFDSAISPAEKTQLDTLVANYVFSPRSRLIETDGKLIVSSSLADPRAIDIRNLDPNGGAIMVVGLGGFRLESDNVVQFVASAESTFTTSAGNLIFDTAGLLNMDSSSGFNIGVNNDIPINIGNTTGSNTLTLTSGTGGHNIISGGIININSSSGGLNLGNNADDTNINIASGGSKVVNIGNTNNFSAVNILSGSFGATFGNDASGGEIQIAVTNPKVLKLGNSLGGTRVFQRHGSGGLVKSQPTPTSLSDSNVSLTTSQLLTLILSMNPTAARDVTLPNAADLVSGVPGVEVGDSIDFSLINEGNFDLSVLLGTGGSSLGNLSVQSVSNGGVGTAGFRIRFDNVTASSEAYTLYRLT